MTQGSSESPGHHVVLAGHPLLPVSPWQHTHTHILTQWLHCGTSESHDIYALGSQGANKLCCHAGDWTVDLIRDIGYGLKYPSSSGHSFSEYLLLPSPCWTLS